MACPIELRNHSLQASLATSRLPCYNNIRIYNSKGFVWLTGKFGWHEQHSPSFSEAWFLSLTRHGHGAVNVMGYILLPTRLLSGNPGWRGCSIIGGSI